MVDSDFWTACFTVGPLFEVAFATMALPARRYLLKRGGWSSGSGVAAIGWAACWAFGVLFGLVATGIGVYATAGHNVDDIRDATMWLLLASGGCVAIAGYLSMVLSTLDLRAEVAEAAAARIAANAPAAAEPALAQAASPATSGLVILLALGVGVGVALRARPSRPTKSQGGIRPTR